MNTIVNTAGDKIENLNVQVESEISQQWTPRDTFLIRFSENIADNIIHDAISIPTAPLEHAQLLELWMGVSASHASNIGDWPFYCNDQYVLAVVPGNLLEGVPIDHATELAYSSIFDQIGQWGYPYLLRTWNFFPEITSGQSAYNNYQLFCSGRARAYDMAEVPSVYPAATVIGTSQPGLYIYFIAAKKSGTGIENTQQVSAFNYPPSYSQDPPLFSRALLHRNQRQEILFISGTASITGHSTQFADDVNRQLEVCLDNLENLLTTASAEHEFSPITLQECKEIKLFLRNPRDLDTVRTHLRLHLGPNVPINYLQGEMCRPDLLVEIEALAINDLA